MTTQTKKALQIASAVGLALSIVPALLLFGGVISRPTYRGLMVLGMVLWFGTAVFWIKADRSL